MPLMSLIRYLTLADICASCRHDADAAAPIMFATIFTLVSQYFAMMFVASIALDAAACYAARSYAMPY